MKRMASTALAFTLLSGGAHAHHSREAFDVTRNVTYRGVVKAYRWQNPHSSLVVTVGPNAKDRSTVGTWTIEASSLSIMTAGGWTPYTYKAGDPITVVAHPNKDGSKNVLLFYVIMPDGKRLYRAAHRYPGEADPSPPASAFRYLPTREGGVRPGERAASRPRVRAAPLADIGSRSEAGRSG